VLVRPLLNIANGRSSIGTQMDRSRAPIGPRRHGHWYVWRGPLDAWLRKDFNREARPAQHLASRFAAASLGIIETRTAGFYLSARIYSSD